MMDYIAPLLLLVVLFVGFGLVQRNGSDGNCVGCSGCADESECKSKSSETDAVRPR